MAILSESDLVVAMANARRCNIVKVSQTAEGAGTFHSLIKANGLPASWASSPATGTGAIPNNTDSFCIPFINAQSGSKKYISRIDAVGPTLGSLIIYDRLWHNSGLVGNLATAQAINSLALTRNVEGDEVEIFGEIYTAIGATAATLSVNYTDADNVARVGTYAHPANAESVGQMFQILPPSGARGCKSVQSATFSVTTGTAGNFGITLLRRLATIPLNPYIVSNFNAIDLGLPELEDDACLCMMVLCSTTTTGNINGSIDIIEG